MLIFCLSALGVITIDVLDEVAVDLSPFISSSESPYSTGLAGILSLSTLNPKKYS